MVEVWERVSRSLDWRVVAEERVGEGASRERKEEKRLGSSDSESESAFLVFGWGGEELRWVGMEWGAVRRMVQFVGVDRMNELTAL